MVLICGDTAICFIIPPKLINLLVQKYKGSIENKMIMK